MKRFLIIALVVMLVVAMLAVPAFADSPIVINFDFDREEWFYPGQFPEGQYRIWVDYDTDDPKFTASGYVSDLLIVDYVDDGEYLSCRSTIQLTDSLCGETVSMVVCVTYDPDLDYTCFDFFVGETFGNYNVSYLELEYYSALPGTVDGAGAADAVLSVFSVIGDWMIAQIPVVGALFYNSEVAELTALGSICVCALGVALVLLLLSLVKRWIQFR